MLPFLNLYSSIGSCYYGAYYIANCSYSQSQFCSSTSSSSSGLRVPPKFLLDEYGIRYTTEPTSVIGINILPSKMGVYYSHMNNNIHTPGLVEDSSPTESHHGKQHQQASRNLENARDQTVVLIHDVLKCSCNNREAREALHKVAFRKTKAKAVSKRRVSKNRSRNQELKRFRRRWQKETYILSRVIQLERELGCEPGLLDILCRLTRAEIRAVWDQLIWLYPDLAKKGQVNVEALETHEELQSPVIA
jgi:hypothetical protein